MNPQTIMTALMALASLASSGKDLFGGNSMSRVPTLNKGQKGILQQIIGQLQGGLGQANQQGQNYMQDLMNPNSQAVNQFTQPYMNQFEQQTIPGISERFAGMGAMGGGLASSGFGQALSSAGGNLQTNLAALKAGLGQQAASQLMGQYGNFANMGLNASPFGYQAPQQGFGSSFLNSWASNGFPGMSGWGGQQQNPQANPNV